MSKSVYKIEARGVSADMEIPDHLRARLQRQPSKPPLDQVRDFVSSYAADAESMDEIRRDLARMSQVNVETVRRKAVAIEALLADPPAEGELARLVGWDGNWVLDDPSDAGAAAWLRTLAQMIREIVAEADRAAGR